MRQSPFKVILSSLCLLVFLTITLEACSSSQVQKESGSKRITKEELKALIDDPDTIIIDVRLRFQWEKSKQKIKGAVHEDPFEEVTSWAGSYPKDKRIVLY